MDEFALIAKYFAPLAGEGGLALTDDAAVLSLPPGRDLVVTVDAMIESVHFLPDDPPDLVARKLLRVNLSDLAAMGAEPLGYVMTTGVRRDTPESWFERFTDGLALDQDTFGIRLLGGDTVGSPGGIALSLTAFGTVPSGRALRRSGARDGDGIFVSGSVGDAYIGLRVLKGEIEIEGSLAAVQRYRLPEPRVSAGPHLIGLATAAIDISDGLVADLLHVCECSNLGAVIETARVPLSQSAATAIAGGEIALDDVLGGGDDYELLFTAPAEDAERVMTFGRQADLTITRIGTMTAAKGVRLIDDSGVERRPAKGGYEHF